MPVEMVCNAFDISRSSYYEYRQRRKHVDVERLALKAQVNRLFTKSRSSAGSRTIKGMLNDDGVVIERFKVRRLMSELGLICKQPGSHAYKQATVEQPDIPNHLAREFTVDRPNQAWCGDITYVWSGQAAELSGCRSGFVCPTRRWLGYVIQPRCGFGGQSSRPRLGTAWSTRKSHVPLGSGKPVCQSKVRSAALALSNNTKHEPTWQLLGQRTDGEAVPESEV